MLREAEAILRRVTYKAGWSLRIDSGIGRFRPEEPGMAWLHIENVEKDSTREVPGTIKIQGMTMIPLDHIVTQDEFMRHVRRAIRDREMHESDEWLQVDGVAPFYPH